MGAKISKLPISKGKIAFSLIIAIIITINIVAGALIFLDIQVIKPPEMTVEIDIIEITAEEASIKATLYIENQNQFSIILKDLEVVTTTTGGNKAVRLTMECGEMPPNSNRTFTSSASIGFNGQSPELLTSKITGTVGANFFGFIKKTMPITITIITSAKDVIKEITMPIIHIQGDFGEITQESINFTGVLDIYNPNSFDINIGDFSVKITTETGKDVGYLNIDKGLISAKSSIFLNGEGRILIESLNAKMLTINVSCSAGATIAGVNVSRPFSTNIQLKTPRIENLLSLDKSTDAVLKSDIKYKRGGLVGDVTLTVKNPNKISIIAKDIVLSIYMVNDDNEQLVGECNLGEILVEHEDVTTLSAQIEMSIIKFILYGGTLFNDWLMVTIRANVTIPGVDQTIMVKASVYSDLHMFF